MTDEKHFSYQGNVDLKDVHVPQKTLVGEILDVEFLTPARISFASVDGKTFLMVSIDIVNRKVYDNQGNLLVGLSEQIFKHLDTVNTLPEDFFMAPDSIREEAENIQSELEVSRHEILGEI